MLAAVVICSSLLALSLYNRLHRAVLACDEAFANLDAALARRHDLVPALVESVRGHCSHERTTHVEVTAARAMRGRSGSSEARGDAEAEFASALGGVVAVAESHPALTTSGSFQSLHRQLHGIEEQILATRAAYNAAVSRQYELLGGFPGCLLAWMFKLPLRAYWRVETDEVRRAPVVRF